MERKRLSILDFLGQEQLDKTLLIGFYGGGNYGDELLLEILQNLMKKQGINDMTIPYKNPQVFDTYHRRFGYKVVGWDIRSLAKGMLGNKNIIIGGGGLWGLDASFKILALGVLLFVARLIFRKNIYMVGVGYYGSAPTLGRISAWLAGKASKAIIGRDAETYDNFIKVQKNTYLDRDMAWYVPEIDLTPYQPELNELEKNVTVTGKTIWIILRRFAAKHANDFNDHIEQFVGLNTRRRIIVSLMEPPETFPEGHQLLKEWQEAYPHIQTVQTEHNPLALFLFFQKHQKNLTLIAPQFHAIITAHLNNVPFLPVVYDNKVAQLLQQTNAKKPIQIHELELSHISSFAAAHMTGEET